jgi:hypothetical protein
MNERIRELAKNDLVRSEYTEFGWQECYRYEFEPAELQRFVKLVVQECCDWIDGSPTTDANQLLLSKSFIITNLKGHFGVEE